MKLYNHLNIAKFKECKMLGHTILRCFTIFACLWATNGQTVSIDKNGISLNIQSQEGILQLVVREGSTIKLQGNIGNRLSTPLTYTACQDVDNCIQFQDVRLHITTSIDNGFSIYWTTLNTATVLEDCFELGTDSWYGGPEQYVQEWPLNKLTLTDFANIVKEADRGAVVEPYWLNSAGAYIFVDERVPLFINQNTAATQNKVCFSAKAADPYPTRNKVVLHYTIAVRENAREAHLHAVNHFLGKPTGHPNYKIIERPIWSTWARYKKDINDASLLEFAQEIVDNGYPNGQFEIDDDWEDCYGALTFRESRFGDITNTVQKIKAMNFTVSLWVHPFVSVDCTKYQTIGRQYEYFAKNREGGDLTQWWNSVSQDTHYLDFTKPEVREWFVERLRNIQENHGIDSFKFDAGESSWAPQIPALSGDVEITPNNIASDYVRTCAKFGDLVEVRVGWRSQDLPVFVRMIDKDSRWGHNNGLYTLITTLLQMNMNGYSMVLPDMIGGNGYDGESPSAELFVRWVQANVFMPSIQFSFVPWDYSLTEAFDVRNITKNMVDLHQKFAPYIKLQMEGSIQNGTPVNAPVWWVDPTNTDAQKEDTAFLLGEDLLAAPVIEEAAVTRSIFLPSGTWVDGNDGTVHEGPVQLIDYPAPIEKLPYFVREGTEAHRLNGSGCSLRVGMVFAIVMCIQFIKLYF